MPAPTVARHGVGFVDTDDYNALVDTAMFARSMPCASSYNTSNGSMSITGTTASNANLVDLDSLEFDKDPIGGLQARDSAHTSRLTFNYSGIWLITGLMRFSPNASGYRQTFLRLNANGSPTAGTVLEGAPVAAVNGTETWDRWAITVARVAGDYVQLFAASSVAGVTSAGTVSAKLQIALVHAS